MPKQSNPTYTLQAGRLIVRNGQPFATIHGAKPYDPTQVDTFARDVVSAMNPTDTTYNGWTNYETWAVKLWIDNDEGSQSYWIERAQECRANAQKHENVPEIWTADQAARLTLADMLKSEHEENAPDVGNSIFSDLMQSALGRVEWVEIATVLLEDAKELAD